MEIRIQSDGQLYPPKKEAKRPLPPPPPKKPDPPKELCPKEEPPKEGLQWEDLLLVAVGLMVIKGQEKIDIPLLLALAYILFDSCFSLKKLL